MKIPLPIENQFEAHLETVGSALHRFLFSLVADNSAAEDLLQETMLQLWKKRADFEPGSNFRAWSFQMAFNIARSHRRKAARRNEISLPSESLLERLWLSEQESAPLWEAQITRLPHCLSRLPLDQRDLVVRRYVGKRSVQELAKEQEITPNTMSQRLYRIKQVLQRCVQAQVRKTEFAEEQ